MKSVDLALFFEVIFIFRWLSTNFCWKKIVFTFHPKKGALLKINFHLVINGCIVLILHVSEILMHHQFGLNGWNQIEFANLWISRKFASKKMRRMDYFCLLKPNWLSILIIQAHCRDRLKCSNDGRLEQQKFTFQIDRIKQKK